MSLATLKHLKLVRSVVDVIRSRYYFYSVKRSPVLLRGGWVAGLCENIAISASIEVEVEVFAELGKSVNKSCEQKYDV